MAKTDLTAQRLRELLDYNPETGKFVRRVRTGAKAPAGCPAGSTKSAGYVYVSIDGRLRLGHRLAWLYINGVWPDGVIDHINGDRSDNRITNLRDVSVSGNSQNMRGSHSDAAVKFLGVSTKRGKWRASIYFRGKSINLGVFATPELASDAYISAKRRLHGTCTI